MNGVVGRTGLNSLNGLVHGHAEFDPSGEVTVLREGTDELKELVVLGDRTVKDGEEVDVILEFGDVSVEGHGGGLPCQLAEFETQLNGFVFRREALKEVVAEVVPPMHVVGEGVGLGTRRTVDVGAAPV